MSIALYLKTSSVHCDEDNVTDNGPNVLGFSRIHRHQLEEHNNHGSASLRYWRTKTQGLTVWRYTVFPGTGSTPDPVGESTRNDNECKKSIRRACAQHVFPLGAGDSLEQTCLTAWLANNSPEQVRPVVWMTSPACLTCINGPRRKIHPSTRARGPPAECLANARFLLAQHCL